MSMSTTTPPTATPTSTPCNVTCEDGVCRINKKKCCPVPRQTEFEQQDNCVDQPNRTDRPTSPTKNLRDLLSTFIDAKSNTKNNTRGKSETESVETDNEEEDDNNEDDDGNGEDENNNGLDEEDTETKILFKLVESHARLCRAFNFRYN